MAPRPFPSTLNIGTDIVLLSRLTRMLSKDPTRFLRRVLTPREHLAFKARFPRDFEHVLSRLREDGKHFELANIVDFIGGRWAAKEACIKAVQPRRLTFQQIEIWTTPGSKAPVAVILDDSPKTSAVGMELEDSSESKNAEEGGAPGVPEPADLNADAASPGMASTSGVELEDVEGQLVKVSISHDGAYCTAVALAPVMH